jgi:trigger factor
LIEDFKGRMKQQGLNETDFTEYKAKWDKEFATSAQFMVKSTFLLDALAEMLNLRATAEEIEAKINEYAEQTKIEMARLQEFYNKPERRSRLAFQVTEEKVVNHLVGKAKITEVAKDKLPKEQDSSY